MDSHSSLTRERRAELDAAAWDLLRMHGVEQPPVPIEEILRRPAADLWRPDLVDLSLQSFDSRERYAARPTIARLVARYAMASTWGRQRAWTAGDGVSHEAIRYLGRALLMPRAWMDALSLGERNPASVRLRFHVPPADAAERLSELGLAAGASMGPGTHPPGGR